MNSANDSSRVTLRWLMANWDKRLNGVPSGVMRRAAATSSWMAWVTVSISASVSSSKRLRRWSVPSSWKLVEQDAALGGERRRGRCDGRTRPRDAARDRLRPADQPERRGSTARCLGAAQGRTCGSRLPPRAASGRASGPSSRSGRGNQACGRRSAPGRARDSRRGHAGLGSSSSDLSIRPNS